MLSILPLATAIASAAAAGPLRTDRLIFPLNPQHNHASCIVALPNGDLLACWYRGSGERTADDVAILGSRLRKGRTRWTEPFVLANTPGFPDCNPCMIVDRKSVLWLFWPVILNNEWESALLRYQTSSDYQRGAGAPRWTGGGVVLLKPGQEFTDGVQANLAKSWQPFAAKASPADQAKLKEYLTDRTRAAGDKLRMRLGWMPRPRPVQFNDGRLFLPLYSDLFDFSLIAFSDDDGRTWRVSAPIVGPGNVQPSLARRKDGTLVAFFRDNGPPPQRVLISESIDHGLTWTRPEDTVLPDPGAGVEIVVLRSGKWVLINNDTESERDSLALTVSDDEGRTWSRKCHLEHDVDPGEHGSYSYPSIIQASDGLIHITYTYTPNGATRAKLGPGKSIKHVTINEAWLAANAAPLR